MNILIFQTIIFTFILILMLLFVTPIVTIVHELGHFAFLHKYKASISKIRIGCGKNLLLKKLFGITFELNLIPITGCVDFDENSITDKQLNKSALAGPMYSLIFTIMLWLYMYLTGITSIKINDLNLFQLFTWSLAWVSILPIFNLIPIMIVNSKNIELCTDGYYYFRYYFYLNGIKICIKKK